MAKTTIKLTGDLELKRKLEQLKARARGALLDAAEAGADVVQADADRRAPGPHIITGNKVVEGGKATVEIGPDKEHWYYQFAETGATAHEITGAPLVFLGERGLIITRKVAHPGMDAHPFLRPALSTQRDAARDKAGEVFRREIDKLVESHGD